MSGLIKGKRRTKYNNGLIVNPWIYTGRCSAFFSVSSLYRNVCYAACLSKNIKRSKVGNWKRHGRFLISFNESDQNVNH